MTKTNQDPQINIIIITQEYTNLMARKKMRVMIKDTTGPVERPKRTEKKIASFLRYISGIKYIIQPNLKATNRRTTNFALRKFFFCVTYYRYFQKQHLGISILLPTDKILLSLN